MLPGIMTEQYNAVGFGCSPGKGRTSRTPSGLMAAVLPAQKRHTHLSQLGDPTRFHETARHAVIRLDIPWAFGKRPATSGPVRRNDIFEASGLYHPAHRSKRPAAKSLSREVPHTFQGISNSVRMIESLRSMKRLSCICSRDRAVDLGP